MSVPQKKFSGIYKENNIVPETELAQEIKRLDAIDAEKQGEESDSSGKSKRSLESTQHSILKESEGKPLVAFEYPSSTEEFLDTVMAPELLSNQGRCSIFVIYLVLIIASLWGITQVDIDFKVDFFIDETKYVYDYFQLNNKYFQSGYAATFYVDYPEADYASEEIQIQIIEFLDNISRCRGCE